MQKKHIAVALSLLVALGIGLEFESHKAQSQDRVFNAPRNSVRLLAKQFVGNANVFTQVDPSPAGTPLTLTSATGQSNYDGSASFTLTNGFTVPLAFTIFVWQPDVVNPGNKCWVRISSSAAGYTTSVDSNYTRVTFQITEDTPFIVVVDKAVTGNVYTDARSNPSNRNSAAGYPQ